MFALAIRLRAATMSLLSRSEPALGVTVSLSQHGWAGGLLGVGPGPIEPRLLLILFAIVFGLFAE